MLPLKQTANHPPFLFSTDIGGSTFRLALYRNPLHTKEKTNTHLLHHKENLGTQHTPLQLVDRLFDVVDRISDQYLTTTPQAVTALQQAPIGIGIAAMLGTKHGQIHNAPHLGWHDINLAPLLNQQCKQHPWFLINDVNAAAIAEHHYGGWENTSSILVVFVGTGIGSAWIYNGKLIEGATGCAGELGHICIDSSPEAIDCACGAKGCLEAYAGGQAIQFRVQQDKQRGIDTGSLSGIPTVHPGHIDRVAIAKESYAENLWKETGDKLGMAIANVATMLNPDCIVLGGGVLQKTSLLREITIRAIQTYVRPAAGKHLAIVKAKLGDDAGLAGSALWAAIQTR